MSVQWRMPGEWEQHEATWIAWPHEKSDWLEKFPTVSWVYAEIVRLIAMGERVEIFCHNQSVRNEAAEALELNRVPASSYRLHLLENDRSWLRDSAPTGVYGPKNSRAWIGWSFNAWAKYDNWERDRSIPPAIAEISGLPLVEAVRPDGMGPLVLEGGAIDADGEGTLLVTEECLLSPIQERNKGLSREGYEAAFREYLGITKTIWLDRGVPGDDTHGHVDDIARFVAPGKVVLAYTDDPKSDFYEASQENMARLKGAVDAKGRPLEVVPLPLPRVVEFGEERLPASYANFYIANAAVVVPTFNDLNDRAALNILSELFPDRAVIGLHSGDLIMGQGAIHCLTQPQFAAVS